MSSKNIGRVYVFLPKIPDSNGIIINGHPFIYFETYTQSGHTKSFLLCQSNDNNEHKKYRYTLKLNNIDMGEPKLIKDTVVNCNIKYVVNKTFLSNYNFEDDIISLGKITKKDLVAINNLWKEAYQRDEHAFLHILGISNKNGKLKYDIVNDKGDKFTSPMYASKWLNKKNNEKKKGITR